MRNIPVRRWYVRYRLPKRNFPGPSWQVLGNFSEPVVHTRSWLRLRPLGFCHRAIHVQNRINKLCTSGSYIRTVSHTASLLAACRVLKMFGLGFLLVGPVLSLASSLASLSSLFCVLRFGHVRPKEHESTWAKHEQSGPKIDFIFPAHVVRQMLWFSVSTVAAVKTKRTCDNNKGLVVELFCTAQSTAFFSCFLLIAVDFFFFGLKS